MTSPSSRRAWVEIEMAAIAFELIKVALLAEGVGRNQPRQGAAPSAGASPSSRRAWVEIDVELAKQYGMVVALLAEGVGRNRISAILTPASLGRPPRGGRG